MSCLKRCSMVLLGLGLAGLVASQGHAQGIPENQQKAIDKGLEWIKKSQHKDGSWSANGQNPVAMTSMAGMALLAEGSTITQGKYREQIRLATDWLMKKSMKTPGRNGLIGNPDLPGETGRYMYGHGFALLFLASVYGEEEDKERRAELKDILTRGVIYCGSAQSTHKERDDAGEYGKKGDDVEFGGWFYTAKGDPPGSNNDEGSVTVTQMQGLRACRDAGIPVPKHIMTRGANYLKKSTAQDGGVVYSYGRGGIGRPAGGGRPALTAAAIACLFSNGDYNDKYVKTWFKFCDSPRGVPIQGNAGAGFNRLPFDEYTHFYYAPSIYFIGEDGWQKMFDPEKKADPKTYLTWSKYRKAYFEYLVKTQSGDGSWQGAGGWGSGPIYSTSVYCVIMQLDNNCLPVFQK